MWALGSAIGTAAYAADRADVRQGELEIEGESFTIRVLGRGVPLFENLFSSGACRVTFTGRGTELVPQVRECPDALRDEVVPSSKYWLFESTGDLTGVTFDVWYLVDGRGVTTHLGPSRYHVRGGELPVWTLEPTSVALPAWPAGQSLPATCRITVTTTLAGAVADVAVADDGCPSGYGVAVADAARTWTVKPVITNQVTVPLVFDAVVRFVPPGDGAGATIDVDLPVAPEVEIPFVGELPPRRRLPSTQPRFTVHHRTYAEVLVYEVGVPEFPATPTVRRCDFLFQVNSNGRTWIWPERCPSDLLPPLEASRGAWSVRAGKPGAGELYARFRGTWEVPAGGGAPLLRIPEGDLVGKPTLPDNVRSYAMAEPTWRVPPKLSRKVVVTDPAVCVLDVTVGVRGHVTSVVPAVVAGHEEPGGCPTALLGPAQKSAARWRWEPARSDGEPFETHATVRVRFGGGGG